MVRALRRDLGRLVDVRRPLCRAAYEWREVERHTLAEVLGPWILTPAAATGVRLVRSRRIVTLDL